MEDRYWASGSSAQWRVPIALQIILALVMIFGIGFVRALTPLMHEITRFPAPRIAKMVGTFKLISSVVSDQPAHQGS